MDAHEIAQLLVNLEARCHKVVDHLTHLGQHDILREVVRLRMRTPGHQWVYWKDVKINRLLDFDDLTLHASVHKPSCGVRVPWITTLDLFELGAIRRLLLEDGCGDTMPLIAKYYKDRAIRSHEWEGEAAIEALIGD